MIVLNFEEVLNNYGYLYWKTIGISMEPLIREGRDTVLIKKCVFEELQKYDVVLFRRPEVTGRVAYVLHRILKINPDGTCQIKGDNCLKGESVKKENIIGVLAEIKRKGKIVRIRDKKYRIYTYLWCNRPVQLCFHYCRIHIKRVKMIISVKCSRLMSVFEKTQIKYSK